MSFLFALAETGRLCWGVKRAINGAIGAREKAGEEIFVFGLLVHNDAQVEELEQQGIHVITSLQEARKRAVHKAILITAHGLDPKIKKELKVVAGKVIDMTCPIVENVHQSALELKSQGRRMILIGKPREHQEVKGIIGVLNGEVFLVQKPSDAILIPYHADEKIGIVAQTTFNERMVRRIVLRIKDRFPNAAYLSKHPVINLESGSVICDDISKKQEELRKRGPAFDAVIVVGDRKSSNTKSLVGISESELRKPTFFVSDARDLSETILEGAGKILVTAGASTPRSSVISVLSWLEAKGGVSETGFDA